MKVTLCAVGRLAGRSEERALCDDYIKRFDVTGRPLGWGPLHVVEVEDRKGGGMAAEARLLEAALPKGALLVTLDERGKLLSSPDWAERFRSWADQGRDLALVIGGADGIDPALRAKADFSLSFGKMVWPHKLVRVMVTEQFYRAASIVAGSPYHRT